MNYKLKLFLVSVLTIFSITSMLVPIHAQDSEDVIMFSIVGVIPDNQIDKSLSYFDLKMEPKQTQTIQIIVTNTSKEIIVANISVNNASTGNNGSLVYSEPNIRDESMKYSIEDIANVKQDKVELQPGAETTVNIDLTMPEANLDGIILGGIYVTAEPKTSEDTKQDRNSLAINNKLAYILGLKLSEDNADIKSDLHLKKITPSSADLRTAIAVNVQNDQAALIKGAKIDAKIYKENETSPLNEVSVEKASIAPNSNFNVIVDWNNKQIENGTYRLKMKITYNEQVWEWDEEFTIKDNEASKVNEEAIKEKQEIPIYIYIAYISLTISILVYGAYRYGKRSTKK